MITSQDIIVFLNQYNPNGTTLTSEQYSSFVSDLKGKINQLSVTVPNATADAITVLYSKNVRRTNQRAVRRI